MKIPFSSSRVAIVLPGLVLLLLFAVRAPAADSDFTFSSPEAGSIHQIGDVLRIQFNHTDTSVRLFRDIIGFTLNNGESWLYFNIALNGQDSISKRGYYDWTIPDSVSSVRNGTMSTISDSCMVRIAYYQTKQSRGESELFSIRDSAASSIAASHKSIFAQRPTITNAKPQINISRAGGPALFYTIDGRLQRIVNPLHGKVHRAAGGIVFPGDK